MRLDGAPSGRWSTEGFRATMVAVRAWWRVNVPYRRASGWLTTKGKA